MSYFLRRTAPLWLTTIISVYLFINYYFNIGGLQIEQLLLSFAVVITTASLGLGLINLSRSHILRIQRMQKGQWYYSIILLVSMIVTIVAGLFYGADSSEFTLLYDSTVSPLGSTLMSLFIVWLAPGAFRAVRIKNVESTALIITLMIILIGGSPIGSAYLLDSLTISSWLNSVLNAAAQRGLKITIGIGLVILGIRLLSGLEKTYLKGEITE